MVFPGINMWKTTHLKKDQVTPKAERGSIVHILLLLGKKKKDMKVRMLHWPAPRLHKARGQAIYSWVGVRPVHEAVRSKWRWDLSCSEVSRMLETLVPCDLWCRKLCALEGAAREKLSVPQVKGRVTQSPLEHSWFHHRPQMPNRDLLKFQKRPCTWTFE